MDPIDTVIGAVRFVQLELCFHSSLIMLDVIISGQSIPYQAGSTYYVRSFQST